MAGRQADTIGPVDRGTPFVIENHDEAYHLWRRGGVSGRTLVHVDAHHDMAWLDDTADLSIGNYVCQAIKDGIVSEVVWVVPDASWETRRGRGILRRHLKALARTYAAGKISIRNGHHRISTTLRVPITVCALDTLPEFTHPVLLDIDTDFLTLRTVEFSRDDQPTDLPWMWPEQLAEALQRKLNAAIVTIAYSVIGGYTPLKWKYLGDALAFAWTDGATQTATVRAGFHSLRSAATTNDPAVARAALAYAAECLPQSAAPQYHLALALLATGRVADARHSFDQAVRIDATYRGPYSSRGFACLAEGRTTEAAAEFSRLLALRPNDPFGLLGLARVAIRGRRWSAAEADLRRALAIEPRFLDAYRYLGDTLVELDRDSEAAAAYARCVKLALEGEASIEGVIRTRLSGGAPRDEHHAKVHAALARIDARAGRLSSAIAGYRMAMSAGADSWSVRSHLAWAYLRQGRWSRAISCVWTGSVQKKRPSQR